MNRGLADTKRSWFLFFLPPENWRVAVIFAGGVFAGLSLFLVYVSNAPSYLSDAPETCVNCHIMAVQYASWSRSSHHRAAVCNDCHVPQDNVFAKYLFKAQDGLRHSLYFTMRWEPQVIRIGEAGKRAVKANCVRCHEKQLTDDRMNMINRDFAGNRQARYCWECHREVPHGRVGSLSSAPDNGVPLLKSPVPAWLRSVMQNDKGRQ